MRVLLYLLFSLTSLVQNSSDSKPETIIPYESVGDMTIDVTTLKICKEKYPDAEYSKYWESSPFLSTGNFVKKVIIRDEGKVFFFSRKKRLGKYYLSAIRLTKDCKGETSDGIGIGSDYDDITFHFTEDVRISKNRDECWITYWKGYADRPNGIGVMRFYCSNRSADESDFVVDKIYMR